MGKDSESSEGAQAAAVRRAHASFVPTWQRFASPPPSAPSEASAHHPYNRQYSHVYSLRLSQLRDRCLASASSSEAAMTMATPKKGGSAPEDPTVVPRILELKEGVLSTVVGTVVKELPLRPKVDTSYKSTSMGGGGWAHHSYDSDGEDVVGDVGQLPPLRTYCSDAAGGGAGGEDGEGGDTLILEDESGRVELVPASEGSDLNVCELATGAVVAVTGMVRAGTGVMEVRSVHFPAPPPKAAAVGGGGGGGERDADAGGERTLGAKVLLLSGLGCGSPSPALSLRRDLLLDYVSGHADESRSGSSIARIIVAGGGTVRPDLGALSAITPRDVKSKSAHRDPAFALKELDLFLSELLSSGVPVDYVPGRYDPTNVNWPQRPIHPCLLPVSGSFVDGMRRSANPYSATVGGRTVLGSDGLNIRDLGRYVARAKTSAMAEPDSAMEVEEEKKSDSDLDEAPPAEKTELVPFSPLELLKLTLKYSHVAPTGPDSLPTFPSGEMDPFVLDELPEVYFAGGCRDFATELVETPAAETGDDADAGGEGRKTRAVCVPSFERTGTGVLVDLDTLGCEVIQFDAEPEDSSEGVKGMKE